MGGMPQPPGPNTPHLRHHHPSPAVVLRTCFSGPRCTVWQREAQLYSSECPRHTCANVCVPSHVRVGLCALAGGGGRGGSRFARASWPAYGRARGTRVSACTHAQSWPRQPAWPPSSGAAADSGRRRRAGPASAVFPREVARPRWEAEARPECRAGAGAGVCPATCFLSCRWRQLWTEGWPPSGRRCLEKWGFWRLSQLPPEFMLILYHFFLQAVTQLPYPQGEWGDYFICPVGLSAVPRGRRTLSPLGVPPAPPGLNRCFPEGPGTPGDILPEFLLP